MRRAHPAGCLLTALSVLFLAGLGVVGFLIVFLGSFNDGGNPGAAAEVERAYAIVKRLGVGAVVLAVLGSIIAFAPSMKEEVLPFVRKASERAAAEQRIRRRRR